MSRPPKEVVPPSLAALKANGLEVSLAKFHQPVRNESQLSTTSHHVGRQGNMWLTPFGLLVEQKGLKPIVVPQANIVYSEL